MDDQNSNPPADPAAPAPGGDGAGAPPAPAPGGDGAGAPPAPAPGGDAPDGGEQPPVAS